MDVDPTARRLIDDYAEAAARRSGLPEPQRSDARLELISHLHDAANHRAEASGDTITRNEHARAAIHALGTADDVDQAFFAPKRATMERAPFMPRAMAYLIDYVLAVIAVNFVLGPVLWLLFLPVAPFMGGPELVDCDFDLFGPDCHYSGGAGSFLFVPFEFVGTLLHLTAVVAAISAFEAIAGQTPGKMVLKLRAVASTGGPLGWRKAILRNLTKAQPFLALADAVLGHLAFGDAKERLSDRYLGTAVVKEAR